MYCMPYPRDCDIQFAKYEKARHAWERHLTQNVPLYQGVNGYCPRLGRTGDPLKVTLYVELFGTIAGEKEMGTCACAEMFPDSIYLYKLLTPIISKFGRNVINVKM